MLDTTKLNFHAACWKYKEFACFNNVFLCLSSNAEQNHACRGVVSHCCAVDSLQCSYRLEVMRDYWIAVNCHGTHPIHIGCEPLR